MNTDCRLPADSERSSHANGNFFVHAATLPLSALLQSVFAQDPQKQIGAKEIENYDNDDFTGLSRKNLLERLEQERQDWLAAGMSESAIYRVYFGEPDENGRVGDYRVWLNERKQMRPDHKYALGTPVAILRSHHSKKKLPSTTGTTVQQMSFWRWFANTYT